ncbi:MAG: hypothetical protein R6U64_03770 [Bacteroidales bacterium]
MWLVLNPLKDLVNPFVIVPQSFFFLELLPQQISETQKPRERQRSLSTMQRFVRFFS